MSKDTGKDQLAAFVYMLQCSDGSYYVGSTRATLEQRIGQHDAGFFGGYQTLEENRGRTAR